MDIYIHELTSLIMSHFQDNFVGNLHFFSPWYEDLFCKTGEFCYNSQS